MWHSDSKLRLIKSSMHTGPGCLKQYIWSTHTHTHGHCSSPYWVAPAVYGSVRRARWWPWSCLCRPLSAGPGGAPARPAAAGRRSPARPRGPPIPPLDSPDVVATRASPAPSAACEWGERGSNLHYAWNWFTVLAFSSSEIIEGGTKSETSQRRWCFNRLKKLCSVFHCVDDRKDGSSILSININVEQ